MHNNGTTPQIILPDKRLLPDLKPQSGVQIQVIPNAVLMVAHIGDQQMPLSLGPATAQQLGMNLISAAALSQIAGKQAEQPLILNTDPETPDAV